MDRRGFTLIEVMFASALLVVVMGTVWELGMNLGDMAREQQAKATAHDEARKGLVLMVRDLEQAARATLSPLPGATLSYQVAADVDGNGSAVDTRGQLELSGARTITRDVNDLNHDGLAASQLVLIDGGKVRVLANGLVQEEDANGNGALDEGEDLNWNGKLDHGVWFEACKGGVRITVETERKARSKRTLAAVLNEVVVPRN